MCADWVKGIVLLAPTGIDENCRTEPSGNVIEKSPEKVLPSGRFSVPESKTISGID